MTIHDAPGPRLAELAATLDAQFETLDLTARLSLAAGLGRAVFTTSLGIEDQVISAAIGLAQIDVDIATLETGRLFAETLALIDETEERFGIDIRRFHPRKADLDDYIARYGLNGFYDSVEARHACCHVRKLVPLSRALEGAAVWVTGLRRSQSGNRAATPFVEYDAERRLLKVNPLADWSLADIDAYVEKHAVPTNPLHKRGYPSIGCEPCTRAIKPGEPERAGRWWWENDEKRECGLHVPEAAASPITSSSL